jgi:hypothetical protein
MLKVAERRVVHAPVTPAKGKRASSFPRRSGRPSRDPADNADPLSSETRIKRAPREQADERDAIEASIDAALRELDSLEMPAARKKAPGRRVPPFPGTGRTQAVPLLPSVRPARGPGSKKGG